MKAVVNAAFAHLVLDFVLFGALAAAGCGGAAPSADARAATQGPAANYFTVSTAQLTHVQITAAQSATWTTTVETTGTVDWDNDHTTQAITQVGGPITRLAVDIGATVKADDPLLFVMSSDIASAVSAYRKAKNRLDQAQKTLDRSRDLLAHKAIADRDMEAAQADYNDAATDLGTTLQALKIFGVTAQDLTDAEHQNTPIRAELPMRAPLAGVVVQRLVLPGQVIQAGTTVAFVLSDTSKVWIQGHLHEKDLTSVHIGDAVDATTPAFPGMTFHGTVSHIDALLDPATRTTLMRIVTDNPRRLLRKDLFVDLTLHDATRRDVIAVPVSAVLYDDQNFPFVYVQLDQDRFAQRLVTLGRQQGEEIEVASGLKAGERVVSQGSVFLQFANSLQK